MLHCCSSQFNQRKHVWNKTTTIRNFYWMSQKGKIWQIFFENRWKHRWSKQIYGVRRIFSRIFPNLPEKFLCDFCLQIISHKDHEKLILVWPPKKGLHMFLGAIFLSQTTLGAMFPGFSGILPRFSEILSEFSTNLNFCGCACPPCTPSFYSTGSKAFLFYRENNSELQKRLRKPWFSEVYLTFEIYVFQLRLCQVGACGL